MIEFSLARSALLFIPNFASGFAPPRPLGFWEPRRAARRPHLKAQSGTKGATLPPLVPIEIQGAVLCPWLPLASRRTVGTQAAPPDPPGTQGAV